MSPSDPRRAFRRPDRGRDEDLDEEMAFHVDALADDLVARGWTPEEARAEARRRFGDPAAVREACRREARGPEGRAIALTRLAEMVRQDASFALRQLVRRPLLSGLTLATLVLGVSATAVVFSVVYATALRPLPFPEPDRLVHVAQTSPQGRPYSISEPNFVDVRDRQSTFASMAGIGFGRSVLTGDDGATSLETMRVSRTFFDLAGLRPLAGRTFVPEEDVHGSDRRVVMLSGHAWRQRFGGDPDVVGRTMILDGVARRVVGVVPAAVPWPDIEVFLPLAPDPVEPRDDQIIEAFGRLAPGVDLADARADLSAIAAELSDEYPESNDGWGARVVPLRDWLVGPRLTRMGWLLLGAVGLLLLMACVSITNLRVAEASARIREMGVRTALGAGRRRIALQLLIESLVLAALGSAAAVGLTRVAVPVVASLGPPDVARLGEAGLGPEVTAVALGAALLAVLLSGMAPAVVVGRSGGVDSLRAGAADVTGRGRRLRDGLVAAQFALAVAVVVAGALMTRSFLRLQSADLGFEPDGMLRFTVRLPETRYAPDERHDYLTRLRAALEGIPGIEAVGATHAPPFGRGTPSNFVARTDREPDRQEDFQPVSWRAVGGGYFDAAGIRLLSGRVFGPDDIPPQGGFDPATFNPPIVVDRALAELLWPDGEDPVGRLLTWFLPGGMQCRVVGVVETVRDERLDREPRPRVYRPFAYAPWHEPSVLVRTAGDPVALVPAIRRRAAEVDPEVPAMSPTPIRRDLRETVAWPRLGMQILVAFGAASMVLAVLGIYGVTAFTVARRRREIGLRVALGADPGGVLALVLRRAMAVAALGIVAGLGLSFLAASVLDRLLYEVPARDPLTFAAVPALLALVAAGAAWFPARRALRVGPREALVRE